jgi:hypothetical protein
MEGFEIKFMRNPELHHADLICLYPEERDGKNGKPYIVRPFSYEKKSGFLHRLKLALSVFMGKLDAVEFKGDETEEDFKRTIRYARWKRENKV